MDRRSVSGRRSKLSPNQWANIERRMAAGESGASLAREHKISSAAIYLHFRGTAANTVSLVADRLAAAHNALERLPMAQQNDALRLADKLRAVGNDLASAAELGAATTHRLHVMAHRQVARLNVNNPLDTRSMSSLRDVGVITKLANESSHIATTLLTANRDAVRRAQDQADGQQTRSGVLVVPGAMDEDDWERMMGERAASARRR